MNGIERFWPGKGNEKEMMGKSSWPAIVILTLIVAMYSAAPVRGAEVLLHPDTIDFGEIGAAKLKKGQAVMTFADAEKKDWSVTLPEGWICKSDHPLTGQISRRHPVKINLFMKTSLLTAGENEQHHHLYNVQLHIEFDGQQAVYQRRLAAGPYQEKIFFNVAGEMKVITLSFHVREYPVEPIISIHPQRIDFGVLEPGQQAMGKIEITNTGRQPLSWKVEDRTFSLPPAEKAALAGQYHSFFRPETVGKGVYRPPGTAKGGIIELKGNWTEVEGYPEAHEKATLKYNFSGTGIIVYFWTSPMGRTMDIYLDNRHAGTVKTYSDQTAPAEYRLPESYPLGSHILTLVSQQGRVTIEGVKILGKENARGQGRWVKVFPAVGVTTREIDYLHIAVDTTNLKPGIHSHYFPVESNGGRGMIEVYAEVAIEAGVKILDVYRYRHGDDLLFTTNPQGEARMVSLRNYQKDGIAFRLFSPGTPGTTEFYRWYNSRGKSHFYSYEANGGGKLTGEYVLEGAIGNIATIRLPNTRPLHRWRHSSTGHYFFTTDSRSEGYNKKGYRYDGIAGYVR
ncbi:MAG TPA: hypothetical protein P5172_04185 [Syntrophales bacterium]|jgi:hypothetical protein|nr:hypothetical protein [Syntrophales bacterium]